jgi:hypothetical protein
MPLAPLRERRDLCRLLRDLGGRQREALAGHDYDALIAVLGERRSVLERLTRLTVPAREWPSRRDRLGAAERVEGDALSAEANAILAQLARAEEEAVAELKGQRDKTLADLREIGSAGRVNAAYRDSLAPATRRSLDVDR